MVAEAACTEDWPLEPGFRYDGNVTTPIELKVTGKIPAYVQGTLYRTGNAGHTVEYESPIKGKSHYEVSHWFDAFGLIHRFEITQSSTPSGTATVKYNSRRTCDDLVEKIRKTGDGEKITFAQRDPCETMFRKFKNVFVPQDVEHKGTSKNICVTFSTDFPESVLPERLLPSAVPEKKGTPKSLLIRTDSIEMQSLDPVSLEPLGYEKHNSFHQELNGQLAGAHMKVCPKTGDIFNFNLEISLPNAKYKIWRIDNTTGKTEILATICEADAPAAYLHSFFLSKNFIILCVWNSKFSAAGMSLLWERSIHGSIAPFESRGDPMFYVIDRTPARRGVVAKFRAPERFFCFHTINAWEEPSKEDSTQTDIVAELCSYENMDIIRSLYFDFLLNAKPSELTPGMGTQIKRWRLPKIESGSAKKAGTALLEKSAVRNFGPELGVINPSYATKPHRYFWSATHRPGIAFFDALAKFDSTDYENPKIWCEKGHTPGEPIFVKDPEKEDEDGGVLLSVILDGIKESSYLLVLDAKDMTEVARAELDFPVTFGFHGRYVNGL